MEIFSGICFLAQIVLLINGFYWLFISFFGIKKVKKSKFIPKPSKRFLLLAPAHNEEKVIGNLIESLLNIDYPRDLFDILVIADNCNDRTAQIAKSLGVYVLEHKSLPGELKGKPYAIKYALDYFGDQLSEDYDAVAIFDADNIVTTNYLLEMNKHLLKGEKLIQCFLNAAINSTGKAQVH